ncbi:tetratricopeptide repeat protein [Candidatus Aerophobetes bacterium]|uniref:Tetratricopeptide repeat protein n=1 Tax=Aerophobetes bacterium TaxID=2030807 RepID=A0A523WD66_UNCAE|nr:MAG: tetratricopeptide repeat protein [Candidatus Aerophobetes bacterium]
MKEKAILRFFLVLIFTLLSLHYAAAQAGRGKARIAGTVTDEQGNPIASAKVLLELMGREKAVREATTNQKGEWAFIGLGSGNWRITISAEGFIPTETTAFVSQIAHNPKIVLTLKKITEVDQSGIQETDLGLIEQAGQLFQERKYDEVLPLLQKFLENNPTAYQTHINIGDCYKEKGEYERAEEEYNLALEAAKTDERLGKEMMAKAMAGIGDNYLKKGDFENAKGYFEQSIELLPDNEILPYNVGEIYFVNQKLDEAIQYYGVAIKIKPDWSLPYYRQGLVYLNKTDYENAKVNFQKFLEIDPNSELADSVKNMLDYLEKIKK